MSKNLTTLQSSLAFILLKQEKKLKRWNTQTLQHRGLITIWTLKLLNCWRSFKMFDYTSSIILHFEWRAENDYMRQWKESRTPKPLFFFIIIIIIIIIVFIIFIISISFFFVLVHQSWGRHIEMCWRKKVKKTEWFKKDTFFGKKWALILIND